MKEAKKSSFGFKSFKILHSVFHFKEVGQKDLKILISPKGTYDKNFNLFTLLMDVTIKDDNFDEDFIRVHSESQFIFDGEIEDEIPHYFTLNAPALTFPFIRAYITTLSAQSGLGTVDLPILNLVDLAEQLKKNIEIIEIEETEA